VTLAALFVVGSLQALAIIPVESRAERGSGEAIAAESE
jgi:hypothetical protein